MAAEYGETSGFGNLQASEKFESDEEDNDADIFREASKYLQAYEITDNENDVFCREKQIFQEPPNLLEVGDYQIAVAKCIYNGLSWEETASALFQNRHHLQTEKTVRQHYFTVLADQVEYQVAERLTVICCNRERKILDLIEAEKQIDIHSALWINVIRYNGVNDISTHRICQQYVNLTNVHGGENDRNIQKMWKKVISYWKRLINALVPHFFDGSIERALLSCIYNWFTSGEMTRFQFCRWKDIAGTSADQCLKSMRTIFWDESCYAKEHVFLFKTLLNEIPGDVLTKFEDFKNLLGLFLNPVQFKLLDRDTRLKVTGKGMFLQDIVSEIEKYMIKYKLKEVNIYSKYFLGIDSNLNNLYWHGINLTIVTDRLTICSNCTIDVSGTGYPREVRPAKEHKSCAKNGSDGDDGKAGESSGNVVILTNKFQNPEKLTIKMNGGSGQGGQHGGRGDDGDIGTGTTLPEFKDTVIFYDSLYFDSWSKFANYHPASGWTLDVRYNESVYKMTQQWIYKVYKHRDGREMIYSFASNSGFINTYDMMFFIKGTRGSIGGLGGKNGIGGQGGNAGTFIVRFLKTLASLKSLGPIETNEKDIDGMDGIPGRAGNPGAHGNDIAMVDRSKGSFAWKKREHQHFFGQEIKKSLKMKHEYSRADKNALNGYRKYREGFDDCYATFEETDIDCIDKTNPTDPRKSTDRTVLSKTVNKQTISIEKLLEEYAEICEGDEFNIGDITDFTELEVEDNSKVEQHEEVQEEISIVRTLVEDCQQHEKTLRQVIVNPNDATSQIVRAMEKWDQLKVEELAEIWKLAFTIPLNAHCLKKLYLLYEMRYREDMKRRAFASRRAYIDELLDIGRKYEAKDDLSRLRMKINAQAGGDENVELIQDELADVVDESLDSFWVEVNRESYKKNLIDPFFNQAGDNDISTPNLLEALYKIYQYLKPHEEVFKPFENSNLNWAKVRDVQKHLETFLSTEEQEKKQEKERLAEEKAKQKQERKLQKTLTNTHTGIQLADNVPQLTERSLFKGAASYGQVETGQEAGEDYREEDDEWNFPSNTDQGIVSRFSNFLPKEESAAFKEVRDKFKKLNLIQVFTPLLTLLKDDENLGERFCVDYGYTYTSLKKEPKPPGNTAQSLIHMYYLTRQILDYNMQLVRYYIPYKKEMTIPTSWYSPTTELPMKTVDDLFRWSVDNNIFRINCDMVNYIHEKGLQCRAYRQMVADKKKVNIQAFSESGFCKMRMVENLNPEYSNICYLVFKEGELKSVTANMPLRNFRAIMNSCQLNIKLPLSCEPLNLHAYFPEPYKKKIMEWTEAVVAATGREMLPRFFQRLFELRGNDMSLLELQFVFNTMIEANINFGLPLEQLCSRMLALHGCINDIFLALRVLGSLKGQISLEKLIKQLSSINSPQIRALFGSKLHEILMTEQILTSLVNMLSHADDRVAELEKLSLKEWVDIANCQRWNSYGPLFEAYGNVGYYIVLLDTIGNGDQRERFERIIKKLLIKNKKVYILEKIISTVIFLINNNEIAFDDDYEKALFLCLQLISENFIQFENDFNKNPAKYGLRSEDVEEQSTYFKNEDKTLYLVTNELIQYVIMTTVETKNWDSVLPPMNNRSLNELIRLSVNPQDDSSAKVKRQKEMSHLEKIISGRSKGKENYEQKLKKINDALKKCYGKELRDTQKIAIMTAITSKKHHLAQKYTGEGKTYVISCIAILRILENPTDTVDIITSSSLLAQRDADAMKALYNEFDIQVGHNCDEDVAKRKLAYKCGVVYGDIARFERDYLLETFYKRRIVGSRTRCNVIVDEVDVMLLDNGSNTLYLSHNVVGLDLLDTFFVYLHKLVNTPSLKKEDEEKDFSSAMLRQKVLADMCGLITKEDIYELLFDKRDATIIEKAWRILVTQKVIDSEGMLQKNWGYAKLAKELQKDCPTLPTGRVFAMLEIIKKRHQEIGIPEYLKPFVISHLNDFIKNAKQGLFMKDDNEYVVDLDRTGRSTDLHPVIVIQDKGTGTDLSTSQWSEGLHQFIQLKHGCRLAPFSLKAVFISNVSYLKGYERLNGLSGTLGSVEESNSLVELYDADMIKIPSWKPKMFNEKVPVLSKTKEEWIQNIFNEVCNQVNARRSVLIICQSIENVKELHKEFERLYERNRSSTNISSAFEDLIKYTREFDDFDYTKKKLPCCKIIISTNLSGRGTDITLSDELVERGGLHVIVSFLPENSRIENQAYGRAARDGQKGSGQIICMVEENNGAANIFQLKQFRDNAEVHRLRSLKQYYDFHISVEEECLKLLEEHCNKVSEGADSTSDNLTITQVIYFALLDKWANWLDSKSDDIKECERTKNKVLKDDIIASVRKFLAEHSLPEGDDYSMCLKWIISPQPLLSIAQIHLETGRVARAEEILDQVLALYPEFGGEAYYYKGIIKQWDIHHALQIQQPSEEEEIGVVRKAWNWTDSKRLAAVNWVTRSVVFSDDCPESLVERCLESILKATEYFLLSRSFFATKIRKRQQMIQIVNFLKENSSFAASRGFSKQQEESIVVLESIISNIDNLLGQRAIPEDVKLGDEKPHLTIRRFKEFMKRADIITPPQLTNELSQQQLQILANNHCLTLHALESGFQKIYQNNEMEEYDGQKIVQAADLAKAFSLPSISGFWESLRRAGCFLSEQVFIAVKKEDKTNVPVLKGYETTLYTLNPFQLQRSAENLEEYDLYDMDGPVADIRNDLDKNIELQEAMEAGLLHIDVIATIDPNALFSCEYLDQFSYVTVRGAATELGISTIDAEWILNTLAEHRIVKRIEAEIRRPPPTQEESHIEVTDENDTREDIGNDTMSTSASPTNSRGENPGSAVHPKTMCVTFFPISRTNCNMFPSCMQPSIQLMLSRNFSYHYALISLKISMNKAVNGENISHKICLPIEPYIDLNDDLQNLGVIQHPRVTSVLHDVYKPVMDNVVAKTVDRGVASTSSALTSTLTNSCGFGEDSIIVKFTKKGMKMTLYKEYIKSVIYKQLKGKASKLCVRKCELIPMAKYLSDCCIPSNGETRKIISNGLRKIAIVKEKSTVKWLFTMCQNVLTLGKAIPNYAVAVIPYLSMVMAGVAAVGTMLYCIMLITENQKIASTLNLGAEEEFTLLRVYHESALNVPKMAKIEKIQRKERKRSLDAFVHLLIHRLELSTYVTTSDEDVSVWLDALEHCSQKSNHLLLLQQAVDLWFKYNVTKMQVSQFDEIFNQIENNNQELPKIAEAPQIIFAFCSILIAEVNMRKNGLNQSKKPIKTMLKYSQYPTSPRIASSISNSNCPLSSALSHTLKKILTPMIKGNISDVIDPALNGLDIAWKKSREPVAATIHLDNESLKKRKLQHSAERLAKKQTTDFLAMDLHNIFHRIAFRGPSKPMLKHMIKYNYPLSPHCAREIFNASVMVLSSIYDLQQLDIELKRGEQTIFTYSGLKKGYEKRTLPPPLVIGLENNAFYLFEEKELVEKHRKYPLELFQVLCGYSPKFSNLFAFDRQSFVNQMQEKLDGEFESEWRSTETWYSNEKLKCSIGI